MAKMTDKQLLMTVCGAGFVLAGLGGFGIWWAKGLVEEEKATIEQIKKDTAAADAQIAKITEVEESVITLRENVGEYVKILPEDDYINNFIRRTQDFVRHSGVRINTITPGDPNQRGKFDQYSYRMSLQGTLWQFLKFLNQFENYERFVRVRDFSLSSGDGRKDAMVGGEVVHQVSMTVETYVYRGGTKGKNVNIANYAAKRDRLRERILANALSIKLRRYDYQDANGRRDIFVDPRQSAASSSQGNPLEVQKQRIQKFSGEISAAIAIVDKINAGGLTYLERAKLEKELRGIIAATKDGVAKVEAQQLITWPPFRLKWNNDVLAPLAKVERMVSDQRETQDDRWLAKEQLENLLTMMQDDMADGRFVDVRDRYNAVHARLGVEPEDERYAIVERIEMVMLYVETVEEFNTVPLDISGVVVQGDGRSGLLVNGIVMEEGEYVGDELVLKSVRAESAEFLYKGFIIVKSW